MCSSPRLIAACHVLHRLLMPRHSPCALISLTSSGRISCHSLPPSGESSFTSSPLLSKSKPLRWVSIWFGASLRTSIAPMRSCFEEMLVLTRIMQASDLVHCSFVLPILEFHKVYFVTSLLLARNFLLASLFSFQGAGLPSASALPRLRFQHTSDFSRSDRNARTSAQTLRFDLNWWR